MRPILLLALALLLPACASTRPAPPAPGPFTFHTYTNDTATYNYAVYTPANLPENPPLVLFLHGRGESGDDPLRPAIVGIGRELIMHPERWPAVVVMPQKPDQQSQWPDHEEAVFAILDEVSTRYQPSRVALTGLSQGGHGAFVIGSRHPERFSRVAPVCGYLLPPPFNYDIEAIGPTDPRIVALAEGLQDTPVWSFHGAEDDVVLPRHSELLHEALSPLNPNARLTIYPGVNHGSWLPAYAEPELPAWLLAPVD